MIETVSEFLGRRSRELAARVGVLQDELNALSAELAVVERCLAAVDEPEPIKEAAMQPQSGISTFLNEQVRKTYRQPEPAPVIKKRGYSSLILKRLPEWMTEYPAGLTIKEVAAKCKVSSRAIRAAFRELDDSGRAVVYHGRKDNDLRVVPLGHVSPAEPDPELEPESEPVTPWIKRGDAARTPANERHKLLDLRSYGVTKDASHLVFDDPPPGRSALDMKQAEKEAAARRDMNGQ